MAELQCFCGELTKSLDDLVTHTIYFHTVEDKDSIDPRVFDMIETENKNVQTEDEDDDIDENRYAENILKTMDSIVVDMLETRNKEAEIEIEQNEIKAKDNTENLLIREILKAPLDNDELEHSPSIKYESIVLDAEELSSMIYENPNTKLNDMEDSSIFQSPNTNRYLMPINSQNNHICNICQATFTLFHNLNKHKRNSHKESNPFPCNECKISFPTHALQKNHLLIHSGKKPYSCNECGKSFKDNKLFASHSVTHLMCKECKVTFSSLELVKEHMTTHTEKTYFQCLKCTVSFSSKFDLKIHVKKEHETKHVNERKTTHIEMGKSVVQRKSTKMKNNIYLHPKLQGLDHEQMVQNSQRHFVRETIKKGLVETKIRRPLNAFMVFSKKCRNMLAESGLHQKEVSKELGRRWKELGQEEKVPYYLEADRLEREHLRQNPDYIYKPGPKKRKPKSKPQYPSYSQC